MGLLDSSLDVSSNPSVLPSPIIQISPALQSIRLQRSRHRKLSFPVQLPASLTCAGGYFPLIPRVPDAVT